ncbi:MAG: primosomal protein N' [Clostridia bacterium]|nr:primosomal protein N' [Clostridia bacterium]
MYAEVIIDLNALELDRIFDYEVAIEGVEPGSRVIVPFGKSKTEGFVVKLKSDTEFDKSRVKKIIRVVDDVPAITKENLLLANKMRLKYHTTYASVLRLFLPSEMRTGKVRKKMVTFASLNSEIPYEEMINSLRKGADSQKGVLEYLYANKKTKTADINNMFSPSALPSLVKRNYVVIIKEQESRSPYKTLLDFNANVTLTNEQTNAVNVCLNSDKPTLIHGVTGSGKTEVYLRLIEDTIKQGKTAIMLVPEISLTPQMLGRLRGRFKDNCAILHSGLSAGEKFDEWWRLRSGEAQIAVGARSAIFAPVENLGLIIIDEEHDGSYESETTPRYVTSEVALFRSKYNGAKLVMGSATPKIESYVKATTGEYSLVEMKERVNGKPLPEVIIADMRNEVRSGNPSPFSSALKYELETALSEGNQAIIFLNRRGYSQKIICKECGYVAKCEHCDVALTYHRDENVLKCHYCGALYAMPTGCVECGGININYSGTGTQKIVDELSKLYPNAKILRMDNDTTQNKEGHHKILKEFGEKKADILVGTQMIAKGHDFPSVTLVGILDADMSLYFSDYRSTERTFQLITQVAGRCGRANKPGKVVLQTFSPKHPVLNLATNYDYKGFFEKEKSLRMATHFPPFADVVRIMVESSDDKLALEVLKTVYFSCKEVYDKNYNFFVYFNKMKSPVKRMKNKYRYQVLARINGNNRQIIDEFYEISAKNTTKQVLCYLEVNPSSLI